MFQILAREIRLNAGRTVGVKPITMLLKDFVQSPENNGAGKRVRSKWIGNKRAGKRVGKSARKGSRKSPRLLFYFSNRWLRLFRCPVLDHDSRIGQVAHDRAVLLDFDATAGQETALPLSEDDYLGGGNFAIDARVLPDSQPVLAQRDRPVHVTLHLKILGAGNLSLNR